MTPPPRPLSLVADVGGTNTRVALADGDRLRPGSVERFRNAEFPGLGAALSAYLAGHGSPDCDAVCAAVAGPVEDGVAALTNLDWRIDRATLAGAARAETAALLNDLQAQGHALDCIEPEKLRPVLEGAPPPEDAPRIVIGVGTGFNVAPVYRVGGRRLVPASESGHASLPVRDEAGLRLARFVSRRHGFADVEEVLSGRGVENAYAWLREEAGAAGRKGAAEVIAGFGGGEDPTALEAARLVARTLGAVAGDLALVHLPRGGVFLSGGVSRALGPHLVELGFGEAFLDKGRFSGMMESFPVSVIEDDFAALEGCAAYLQDMAGR